MTTDNRPLIFLMGTTVEVMPVVEVNGYQIARGQACRNPDGSWTFDGTDPAYDSVPAGETALTFVPFTVTDEHGATDTETVTITITGSNDAPVVSSAASQSAGGVVEAGSTDAGAPVSGTASATGTLTALDPDSWEVARDLYYEGIYVVGFFFRGRPIAVGTYPWVVLFQWIHTPSARPARFPSSGPGPAP